MGEEEVACASEVTAVLEAFTGTSVDFLTKEAKGDQGGAKETVVHITEATSVWYSPN